MVAIAATDAGAGGFLPLGQLLGNAKVKYADDGFLGERTSSEKDQRYKRLPSNAKALRTSLDAAVALDKQEVDRFLRIMMMAGGFAPGSEIIRDIFLQDCHNIVSKAYGALERVEGQVKNFEKFLDVPEKLSGDFHDWSAHAQDLKAIIDPIPQYGHIPNWQGPASQEYLKMTQVQVEACKELFPRAKEVCQALHFAESINYGVLSGANSNIETALGRMRQRNGVTEGRFYVNTGRCGAVLAQLATLLGHVLKLADVSAANLQRQLEEIESSARVLHSGWPSGSSQHGQEGVPSPEINMGAPTAPQAEGA